MKFLKVILAALALTVATACDNTKDYSKVRQRAIPLSCEGVALGIDLIVKNADKVSDATLNDVRIIRNDTASICTSKHQPDLDQASQQVVIKAVQHLMALTEKEGL